MSSMLRRPPITQLEIGHDTNLSFGSISVTSRPGSHWRRYLAQVAPPKPAPTTTTRARVAPGRVAQPANAAATPAPVHFRKSRRFRVMIRPPRGSLQAGEVFAQG